MSEEKQPPTIHSCLYEFKELRVHTMSAYKTINEYHATCPVSVREKLEQLRQAIAAAAPHATEVISYGMPAFRQNKVLVYYAAYARHIGFYPTPGAIVHFTKELKPYNTSKGAIQFPQDKPLPLALIKKIVQFRVKEDGLLTQSIPKSSTIPASVTAYNNRQTASEKKICALLAGEITRNLHGAENKIWHAHPVWFLQGNPIVGYNKLKAGIRLLFWSGAGFEEKQLAPGKSGKFKDASITFTSVDQISSTDLKRWLLKAKRIQWDYKNIVKRKGKLVRLS